MENMSLFDLRDTSKEMTITRRQGQKLDVVRMSFEEAKTITWQGLFSGFNTLHAITYSSGIGFACELLKMFDHAEIIFGCDEVMS